MKTSYIIGIVLVAVLVAIIVSMYGNTTTYATIAIASQNPDKTFHVKGNLDRTKPQVYNELKDPNYFEFYLKDSLDDVMKVVYRHPRPQDFERSENVVVKGKMHGDAFEAKEILLKCPSKYNENKVEVKEYSSSQ